MDQGYNGLEDGERRAHTELPDEATEDRSFRSFMRLLSTGRAEVLDMGDLPAFSSVTMAGSRAAHALTMGQIAPDTTGAPSVNPAVQVDVMPTVAERLKFFGGASRMCQQVDTPGDTRKKEWPQSDDLEMGEIHLPDPADLDGSGFRASATEQDWDLDVIEFPCYRTDSKYFDVSMETMEQLGINVEEFIRRKVIRRLGRIADHHYTNNATDRSAERRVGGRAGDGPGRGEQFRSHLAGPGEHPGPGEPGLSDARRRDRAGRLHAGGFGSDRLSDHGQDGVPDQAHGGSAQAAHLAAGDRVRPGRVSRDHLRIPLRGAGVRAARGGQQADGAVRQLRAPTGSGAPAARCCSGWSTRRPSRSSPRGTSDSRGRTRSR